MSTVEESDDSSTQAHVEITIQELKSMDISALKKVMDQGHSIDLSSMNNSMYKGYSLGSPEWLYKLSWHTFRKAFVYDESLKRMRGWNVRMEQNGTYDDSRIPKKKKGKDWSFGHYDVLDSESLDKKYIYNNWDQGVVLDYRNCGNPLSESAAYTPLVAVNKGSDKLLLGWEVFKVGPFLIPIKNAWAIEYEGELDNFVPRPK